MDSDISKLMDYFTSSKSTSVTWSSGPGVPGLEEGLVKGWPCAPCAPACAWACALRMSCCAAPKAASISLMAALHPSMSAALWAVSSLLMAASMAERLSAGILSPNSSSCLRLWNTIWSARLRVSTRSRSLASAAALAAASSFMRWISASVRPDDASMRMDCCLPVALSFADTLRIPFSSISNVTSIWGMPRGAGAMPSRWKRPRVLSSFAMGRSPWRTTIFYGGLVVGSCREYFGFFGRDCGVGFDEFCHDAAESLDTYGEGHYVEKDDVLLNVAGEHAALDGCAHGYHFVGVDALGGFFAEDFFYFCLDGGDTCGTAHEDYFVDFGG